MKNHWLNTSEYPFSSHYFTIDSHKLHYIDEGKGEILLFVHGTPSWSFDFRNIIKTLSSSYRCIAIDHIGFGLSDKPWDYDYSTIRHSENLKRFIESQNLNHITLVVHDFGGPIGLNFAIKYPDKIKNIVILNSWLWSAQNDPDFIKMSRILKSPMLPFLYLYFNFSPRFILPRSFGDKKISQAILKQYTLPFATIKQRKGPLAFARSLLNDQDWFQSLWGNRKPVIEKPVLLIWGMKDPVLKPTYLQKFISGFKNTQTLILDTCGHFPQEEESERVSQAILEFISVF